MSTGKPEHKGTQHRLGMPYWDLIDTYYNCVLPKFRTTVYIMGQQNATSLQAQELPFEQYFEKFGKQQIVNCINHSLRPNTGRWVYLPENLSPALVAYAKRIYRNGWEYELKLVDDADRPRCQCGHRSTMHRHGGYACKVPDCHCRFFMLQE